MTPEELNEWRGNNPWRPDLSKPGFGLYKRHQELLEMYRAGRIAREQYEAILGAHRELAQVWVTHANDGIKSPGHSYTAEPRQDEWLTSNRLSNAAAAPSEIPSSAGDLALDRPSGSELGDKYRLGLMELSRQQASDPGGLHDLPNVDRRPGIEAVATANPYAPQADPTDTGRGQLMNGQSLTDARPFREDPYVRKATLGEQWAGAEQGPRASTGFGGGSAAAPSDASAMQEGGGY